MTNPKTQLFTLTDSEGNPDLASVDDLTLEKGAAEPTELTADQATRLRQAGAHLSEHDKKS